MVRQGQRVGQRVTPEDEARADSILENLLREWRIPDTPKNREIVRGTFGFQRRVLASAVGAAKDATLDEIRRRLHRPHN